MDIYKDTATTKEGRLDKWKKIEHYIKNDNIWFSVSAVNM